MSPAAYTGRFAPSPTGALHAGSLVAALASWLDARAHGGRWLLRIEDVDAPRCVPGADRLIIQQLSACGLTPDEPPSWQSTRGQLYEQALKQLREQGLAYPCACSRSDIARAHAAQGHTPSRGHELPYPGTCRPERGGLRGRPARAWRLHTARALALSPQGMDEGVITWHDRRLGPQRQNITETVGDGILRRADGLWAYLLAVVVDDAAQGITHVVRGQDLADQTPRQILLQTALGLPTPRYLHTPLVLADNGEKLSKQNRAQALDTSTPAQALQALRQAASALSLPPSPATTTLQALQDWTAQWAQRWLSERN